MDWNVKCNIWKREKGAFMSRKKNHNASEQSADEEPIPAVHPVEKDTHHTSAEILAAILYLDPDLNKAKPKESDRAFVTFLIIASLFCMGLFVWIYHCLR